MGLPKNYQKQNTQIEKRFDALNDLNYYKVGYEYRLNSNFIKTQIETYDWGSYSREWPVPNSEDATVKYEGFRKFSALNDEKATEKITEWLDKQVESGILSEYELISMEKSDLHDILEEKGLLPLFSEEFKEK